MEQISTEINYCCVKSIYFIPINQMFSPFVKDIVPANLSEHLNPPHDVTSLGVKSEHVVEFSKAHCLGENQPWHRTLEKPGKR